MKIIITDDAYNSIAQLDITEIEQKLFETDVVEIQDWVFNAVQNKIRRIKDFVMYQDGILGQNRTEQEKAERITTLILERSPLMKSGKEKKEELRAVLEVKATQQKTDKT